MAEPQVTRTAVSSNQRGCTSAVEKKDWGWEHEEPWNQTKQIRQRGQKFSRYTSERLPMHHQRMWTSSLAVIRQTLSLPPAGNAREGTLRNRAGHTHTHTSFGQKDSFRIQTLLPNTRHTNFVQKNSFGIHSLAPDTPVLSIDGFGIQSCSLAPDTPVLSINRFGIQSCLFSTTHMDDASPKRRRCEFFLANPQPNIIDFWFLCWVA